MYYHRGSGREDDKSDGAVIVVSPWIGDSGRGVTRVRSGEYLYHNSNPIIIMGFQLTPLYYAKRLRSYEGFPTPPQQVKFPKALSTYHEDIRSQICR
ncbi:B-cell CLL/lymphoma 9 protein [Frankliniella fusca]|uniref:B-cell CLL/lymphoma 9 protein n=1 Tax=Frankliniella fusca TaxID=407009 RepID=A0AAE1H5E5_9NEOP|nr:B-cell CLL/lymphoma 9 protein [Frankliniella fusca]